MKLDQDSYFIGTIVGSAGMFFLLYFGGWLI